MTTLLSILKKIWAGWKRFGQFINDWVARIFLTVFYFTIFMPFGIGVRLFSDPLVLRAHDKVRWQERTTQDQTLADGLKLH